MVQSDDLQINAKSCMLKDTNNPHAACMYDCLVRTIYFINQVYEYEESKEIPEGSPTKNIVVGNCSYRLRRADRWENIPKVSSEA